MKHSPMFASLYIQNSRSPRWGIDTTRKLFSLWFDDQNVKMTFLFVGNKEKVYRTAGPSCKVISLMSISLKYEFGTFFVCGNEV